MQPSSATLQTNTVSQYIQVYNENTRRLISQGHIEKTQAMIL